MKHQPKQTLTNKQQVVSAGVPIADHSTNSGTVLQNNRPSTTVQKKQKFLVNKQPQALEQQLQAETLDTKVVAEPIVQKKENNTGLPDRLKAGIENLSGHTLDDVKVHYNSSKPAQLQAHAYAQGTEIHIAAGQEKHLPHEAWHVVQQKQGRVKPTVQLKGGAKINDDVKLEREADQIQTRVLQAKTENNRPIKTYQKHSGTPSILQGKFFFGAIKLDKKTLKTDLNAEVDGLINFTKPTENKGSAINGLSNKLWTTYGNADKKHMEIGTVVKVVKEKPPTDTTQVLKVAEDVETIDQRDVNTPENFRQRISTDTRLNEKDKKDYIKAFNNRKVKPEAYQTAKTAVKATRTQGNLANTATADGELRTGAYFLKTQKGVDFRGISLQSGLPTDLAQLLHTVEVRVLGMKNKLKAAWYYNSENEKDIFDAHELRSVSARKALVPKGTVIESKSMAVDLDENKTGGYFYSFIEHEDSAFNTNTRFTGKASADGTIDARSKKAATGRRLRMPLSKMVKAGAMMMGGDLADDKQEREKMGLAQNKTPNKLFASSNTVGDKIDAMLRNYIQFIGKRIHEAMPSVAKKTKRFFSGIDFFGMIDTTPTKGELAIAKFRTIGTMTDQELWEYLVREIAQPQLMTPLKVSTSMKNVKLDDASGNKRKLPK